MLPKLLITGAGGFLGWNLCREALAKWQVFGVYRSHSIRMEGVTSVSLDITDAAGLRTLFHEIQPDAVIHMAAESRPDHCQQHPSETRIINVDASANIASLCADRRIPCVFTSSDLIFDGENAPYSEADAVNPVSFYGEQKAEAETVMQARYPETVVCRMPLMFGYSEGASRGFDHQMIRTLREGKIVRLFSDEYRTPADAQSAAKGLLLAADHPCGKLHLGGRTRISRYEMGNIMARVLGADVSQIVPILQKDLILPAPRPRDVSLDSSKAYAMGYDPSDIDAAYLFSRASF